MNDQILTEIKVLQDHLLAMEMEMVRAKHPDIDFDNVGQSGKTLEVEILEYALKNKIRSFAEAYRSYSAK